MARRSGSRSKSSSSKKSGGLLAGFSKRASTPDRKGGSKPNNAGNRFEKFYQSYSSAGSTAAAQRIKANYQLGELNRVFSANPGLKQQTIQRLKYINSIVKTGNDYPGFVSQRLRNFANASQRITASRIIGALRSRGYVV